MAASANGGTQIVADFRLDQQFLEDFDDAAILFGRALDVAAAPFLGDDRFGLVAGDLALRFVDVALVPHNNDGHAVATNVEDLFKKEERGDTYIRYNLNHTVYFSIFINKLVNA